MQVTRELQYKILKRLRDVYGFESQNLDTWEILQSFPECESEDALVANLLYLEEHELIKSGLKRYLDGGYGINKAGLKITSKGIDFIAEDGGLSAILNTVTVKLHDDSLARLEQFVIQASLTQQDKEKYLRQLRSLPADATKHLLLRLLDSALDNAPVALQLLQKFLS